VARPTLEQARPADQTQAAAGLKYDGPGRHEYRPSRPLKFTVQVLLVEGSGSVKLTWSTVLAAHTIEPTTRNPQRSGTFDLLLARLKISLDGLCNIKSPNVTSFCACNCGGEGGDAASRRGGDTVCNITSKTWSNLYQKMIKKINNRSKKQY
jgi:hypothetical protein